MKRSIIAAAAAIFLLTNAGEASAAKRYRPDPLVDIQISISEQEMFVDVDGLPWASWKVSTARNGYYTPRGSYGVQRMARKYYSQKYDNAPMHYSVFFKGGYAIHATEFVRSLGRPASHGCVRLHPKNAARLFSLVQKYGMSRTRITLVD